MWLTVSQFIWFLYQAPIAQCVFVPHYPVCPWCVPCVCVILSRCFLSCMVLYFSSIFSPQHSALFCPVLSFYICIVFRLPFMPAELLWVCGCPGLQSTCPCLCCSLQTTISTVSQSGSYMEWKEAARSWSVSPSPFRPESPGPSRNIHRIHEKRWGGRWIEVTP